MILDILEYPDERLYTVAEPVTDFDSVLAEIVYDMYETMFVNKGIGLAATQVDIHQQIIVTWVNRVKRTYVNPVIISTSSAMRFGQEGCLSFPGLNINVNRFKQITINAHDINGDPIAERLTGLLAVCVQHETDHLKGKLFNG